MDPNEANMLLMKQPYLSAFCFTHNAGIISVIEEYAHEYVLVCEMWTLWGVVVTSVHLKQSVNLLLAVRAITSYSSASSTTM